MPKRKTVRRLPAEWEPQSGVQLTWPHAGGDWGSHLDETEACFAAIAAAITAHTRLLIVHAPGTDLTPRLQQAGVQMDRVVLVALPSNDVWARDHGPITVLDDERPVLLDFVFNGWGGKYQAAHDNALSRHLHAAGVFGGTEMHYVNYILEGGAIDSDGRGTILTTASCLLDPARNPGVSKESAEQVLRDYFGADRVLWLHHGRLAGDDTDGHVDTLARFCDNDTIAYVACNDAADQHYESLQRMAEEIQGFRTPDGRPYHTVALPLPEAMYDDSGQRMPATYANFLALEWAVLVPTYGVPQDDEALEKLTQCFPGWRIIGIPCVPLIREHGSLHCVTMQYPRGVLA